MRDIDLLIVDDEPDLRWVLRGLFEDEGFRVREAADGQEALAAVAGAPPDVVLSDMRMPNLPGIGLLRALRREHPDIPVVLLSAVEDLATAVEAVKEGAFDYQAKPFEPRRLVLAVRRAAEQRALKDEVAALRRARTTGVLDFGPSRQAQQVRRTLELVGPRDGVTVLLRGESGTGKEVAAQQHGHAVDCGALPEHLLESQLFGHEKGAFTGADRARTGLFPMADGGTLFLDELGNLPLPLQAKLLRALQERTVTPLGSSKPAPFRARVVAATNADLAAELAAGRFRTDLYHRLAEFEIALPPLRERPEDVLPFARRFLGEANDELGRHVQGFTKAAESALQRHPWPGNLRELRNAVRRAALVCGATDIDASDLELHAPTTPAGHAGAAAVATDGPLADRMRSASDALEAEILRTTLAACDGNKAAAARVLQIDYTTLHRKLKRHGLAT